MRIASSTLGKLPETSSVIIVRFDRTTEREKERERERERERKDILWSISRGARVSAKKNGAILSSITIDRECVHVCKLLEEQKKLRTVFKDISI